MEDGIVSCQERSLQDANQVLLLFWLIESPRWLPTAGHSLMYDPMGNMIKKNSQELLYSHDQQWRLRRDKMQRFNHS